MALAEAPEPQGLRKVVTIVFCDLAGSTSLGEQLDPESLRQVITRYFGAMSEALVRHGGTVEKFIGDAVMAVFGIPTVREDDALRAVRAAVEMRAALAELNDQLESALGRPAASARTGVNTGEVIAGDPSLGQALRERRRRQRGRPARAGRGTRRDPDRRPHARARPRRRAGRAGPAARPEGQERAGARLPAGRGRGPRRGRCEPRLDAPLVGRERELALLRDAFDRAVAERRCELVTLVGPAGMGKSAPGRGLRALARAARPPSWPGAASPTARASPSGRCARSSQSSRAATRARARSRRRPVSSACCRRTTTRPRSSSAWPGRSGCRTPPPSRRDLLGGAQAARGGRRQAAARRPVRGHPLGRADLARADRAPGRRRSAGSRS